MLRCRQMVIYLLLLVVSLLIHVHSLGNTFGKIFRVTTFGESHGPAIGVVVDGCPPRLRINSLDIQRELDRRRPGQSRISTPRKEEDKVEILSGIDENDYTLGTPIGMIVRNTNHLKKDYDLNSQKYRPSHADATYDAKYGIRAISGGGRSSARETVARVAAGAIATSILWNYNKIEIVGYVKSIHDVCAQEIDLSKITRDAVDSNIVRCPDTDAAMKMIEKIDRTRVAGDSVGGVVEVLIRNVPSGWGAPIFDRLEAELAKACLSIPACKGFEVGSGFGGTRQTGKEHNDEFYIDDSGRIRTRSNRSGGIQGGISNGEDIVFRAAFKPTSTIYSEQHTATRSGMNATIRGVGRHDPCVVPRAVPIVEAMAALALVDAAMQHNAQCRLWPRASAQVAAPIKNVLGKAMQSELCES